ncbi:MAG: hypothetical protein GY899_07865, partial [Verrucomicrobiaceae bacterium]|nr:hypothetical protein [Verrucomicrobiaceae bacterium]
MQTLNLKIFLTVVFAFSAASHSFSAPIVKSKGKGFVVYKAIFGPKKEDKDAAIRAAMDNALLRFEETFSEERAELYRRAQKQNHFRGVNMVTGYTIVFDEIDKKKKRYTALVEATINMDAIEQAFRKLGPAAPDRSAPVAVANPAPVAAPPAAEETYMTFVFVARELASRRTFDDKKTDIEILESAKQGKQDTKISEDGLSAESKQEKVEAKKRVRGGSKEQKGAERAYRTFTVTAVDNAVTEVLASANFEPVAAIDAGLDVDAFKADFGIGNDISATTRRAAVALCRENGIRYLAVANMEVGLPRIDPNTGLKKVTVDVTCKISDLVGKFPKTLASVAGIPYFGL